MPEDNFLQRKKDVLSKLDKSFKARRSLASHKSSMIDTKKAWDKRILGLCTKINSSNDYYTTSSCSGRVVLMLDEEKKQEGLFIKIYHDEISFEQLKKGLNDILNPSSQSPDHLALISVRKTHKIKFKLEPCILHVACQDLNCAQKLFDKAKFVGWKKSGIIATKNHIMLELNSTERLEFPIIHDGEVLVDDKFLKIIVNESNKKLKKSWEKIKKLKRTIYNYSIKNKNL